MKTLNSLDVYGKVYQECMLRKREFWQKYSSFRGDTKEQIESRDLVKWVNYHKNNIFYIFISFSCRTSIDMFILIG